MADNFQSKRAVVPTHALVRPLPDDEAVVLNLDTEVYFGLNATGLKMWNELTAAPDVGTALARLSGEFDVDEQQLRTDLETFIGELLERGLLELAD
jgi:hypothetical protein